MEKEYKLPNGKTAIFHYDELTGIGNVTLEIMDSLIESAKKQIPVRPDYEGDGYSDGQLVYDTFICPSCGTHYEVDYDNYMYCPKCGQRLDLTEVDTDDT